MAPEAAGVAQGALGDAVGRLAAVEKIHDGLGDGRIFVEVVEMAGKGAQVVKGTVQAAIDARTWLEDLFQCECPGFAWPCGRYTPETCRALREAGFAYGRTTQNSSDVAGCEETMALHPSCHFQANDFYGRYEEAKKTGVFYFWGHSYEMQEYDELWRQLEMKIQFISEDPDSVWADVIDIVPECHRRSAR